MANKTVYPYGTDGQLPSGVGIINDLVTGGADKALSAEMGKVLGKIAHLEAAPCYNEGILFVDENLNIGIKIDSTGIKGINILTTQ